MINDAVLCQEDNAAKHILVSKQAETWSCATGMLYVLLLELQLNHEYVLCGTG